MTRRVKILRVTPDAFLMHLKGEVGRLFSISRNPLPADAKALGVRVDERGDWLIGIESATFPEVPDGQVIPYVDEVWFSAHDPN